MKKIEAKLNGLFQSLASNLYIQAMSNSFSNLRVYFIIGSLFYFLSVISNSQYQQFMERVFTENWHELINLPLDMLFSYITVILVFAVTYNYQQLLGKEGLDIAVLSVFSLFIVTPFNDPSAFGPSGIIVGLLVALLTVRLFNYASRDYQIKVFESIPPEVIRNLMSIIPYLVVIIFWLIVNLAFAITPYASLYNFIYKTLFTHASNIGSSYIGALLFTLLFTVIWGTGINSGAFMNSLLRPVWIDNQLENLQAYSIGTSPLPNIVNEQFFDMIWMGGAGATLGLVISLVLLSKSNESKLVGKMALAPGIFNINEPVLFGLPIIMNPILLVPFSVAPLVMVTIQYFAMYYNIVARPIGVVLPWTIPPVISGFLLTGSVSGAIIQIINLVVSALIYLPFIKIMEKNQGNQNE